MSSDPTSWLATEKQWVEAALNNRLPDPDTAPATLHEGMRYVVLGGGKRLRGILVRAAAAGSGGDPETAEAAASAVEILHAYSLVHDDLPCMDDDDLRRGRPTAHKVYGEANAVLIGDALLTLAFEWAAEGPHGALLVGELARAAGHAGMVGGQVADLAAEGQEPGLAQLQFIHRRKTGALLIACLRMGGIVGGASDAVLDALTRFGEHLGLAFQITDDLLDITADEAALGKPVGSDKAHDKMTYPALMGLDGARKKAAEHTRLAMQALDHPDLQADQLRRLAEFVLDRDR